MNWEAIVWTVLMVAFLIVEAACPIHLVSIWFAVGALIAMVASLLGGQLWLQVVLFLVASAGLLALFWPVVRKFLNPKVVPTNVDSIIGTKAMVTAPVDNINAHGQVKINGLEWTARSESGEPIPEGTMVEVRRVEGVKVFVTPVENNITV